MIYFFQNIYTLFDVYTSFFYFNEIKYIDYNVHSDTDLCDTRSFYKIIYNFIYHKLETYE